MSKGRKRGIDALVARGIEDRIGPQVQEPNWKVKNGWLHHYDNSHCGQVLRDWYSVLIYMGNNFVK